MSSGLSIKGGNALCILCSNELLILNVKFFLVVSCTYRCTFEMENGSNIAQCCSCISFLAFQNGTISDLFFFLNPLRINKGKGAEY